MHQKYLPLEWNQRKRMRNIVFAEEMSPASKSKSKEKRAAKEPQKASSKPSGPANAGSGIPASAYNPLLGTFHTLETTPASSASPVHINGRFRNIDETNEHSGSLVGAGVEYDAVSNNDSCSGESDDHKDKSSNPPVRQEAIPGADNDKREKIRQKNERKHQRQKERRAQELHEKCSGYLMSRKLEALAQQLVAMGFSLERATMALILNEGRVEESVAWLFEGGEEADKHRDQNLDGGSNLKIDISEELARIADMEVRYNCSKQEVERAIVACEGDLEKAAETWAVQKQEPPVAPPKPEETGDPPTVSNGKLSVGDSQNSVSLPPKANSAVMIQQRREEMDFNYTKAAVSIEASSEPRTKNMQPLRTQAKLEWVRPQQNAMPAEKRWPNAGTNPTVSYSLASPLQVTPPPAKTETRHVSVGSEFKNIQPGSVREPVIMMQRPQSINAKQAPTTSISSSPSGTVAGWYPSSVEIMNNGLLQHIPSTRSLSPNNHSSNQLYHQLHYQQHQQFMPGSSPVESPVTNRGNGLWSRTGTFLSLAAASSPGLFSGLGSTDASGSSSGTVDWSSGGLMLQLDYTNIDWSLDRSLPPPSRSGGLWMGLSYMKNTHSCDSNPSGGMGVKAAMRSAPSNGSGVSIAGLPDGGGGGVATAETSTAGSREWTSPFEGKDLFSLPREFVSSSL